MCEEKISVIVPIYNAELYLDRCLKSIINNTYRNLEIICINDGSTDTSLNILESYKENDSRIIVISQENRGVSSARNKGLEIATGEYISFVGLSEIKVFLECRNAEESVFGDGSVFLLRDYLESGSF